MEHSVYPIQSLSFCYPWRPYQQRVIEAIETHLNDKKLHIVAAPGAGKTTLGLEVFRRLGNKALVLSPTRIIRDQWIQRLEDFVSSDEHFPPQWCSTTLDAPGWLTSITYQALHTRHRQQEQVLDEEETDLDDVLQKAEVDELARQITQADIKTLILDEAHHLTAKWWEALQQLIEQVPDISLVSLTATPPYDALGSHWQRYEQLCGPIDEEISVPELVKAGTLCPHQDFCYLLTPGQVTTERLEEHDRNIERALSFIEQQTDFASLLALHPWLDAQQVPAPAELLEHIESVFGLLVWRKYTRSPPPYPLMENLDINKEEVPEIDIRWWEVLLNHLLFSSFMDAIEGIEAQRKIIKQSLRQYHLLKGRKLLLRLNPEEQTRLSQATEKLDAISEIYQWERETRKDTLRQVILTDYIRDEDIDDIHQAPSCLGAWPVFQSLYQTLSPDEQPRLALLTGRLVIVHQDLAPHFQSTKTRVSPAPFDPGFCLLQGDTHQLCQQVTELLNSGTLQVLVGTRALLGEGWDCPAVNSLILASYVGAFVTTNQMRGRAIRIDRQAPDKVASIWHLAAVHQDSQSGLQDYAKLHQRFDTFVGLHHRKDRIESGMYRLGMPAFDPTTHRFAQRFALAQNNKRMFKRLQNLNAIQQRWQEATQKNPHAQVIPSVGTASPPSFKNIYFQNTLGWLVLEVVLAFLAGYSYIMAPFEYLLWRPETMGRQLLLLALLAGFVWALPKLFRALKALLLHYPVDGSLNQIARALQLALCDEKLIQTPVENLTLECANNLDGSYVVALKGGTFYESTLFADALNELLSPLENPRYLITRRRPGRQDYHAVPRVLAANKQRAQNFFAHWQRHVSNGELLYTRHLEGRQHLLKARARSFSTVFTPRSERLDRWQ